MTHFGATPIEFLAENIKKIYVCAIMANGAGAQIPMSFDAMNRLKASILV